MSNRAIWLVIEGQPQGPHAEAEVTTRFWAGELGGDVAAWHEGLDAWSTLGELGLTPPPPAETAQLPAPVGAAAGTLEDSAPVIGSSLGDGEALERAFAGLVKKSWAHYNHATFASTVDEVLIGALITVMVERGSALIDLHSDGTHHFTRFERLEDKSRTFFRLHHLTPDPVAARVQGHLISIIVGYGEFIDSFASIWGAVKAEFRSGLIQTPEPGTITVDGDMDTRYVYVQVDLYWDAGDYVGEDWRVDYARLGADMDAALHVLKKYLRGRFRPGKGA